MRVRHEQRPRHLRRQLGAAVLADAGVRRLPAEQRDGQHQGPGHPADRDHGGRTPAAARERVPSSGHPQRGLAQRGTALARRRRVDATLEPAARPGPALPHDRLREGRPGGRGAAGLRGSHAARQPGLRPGRHQNRPAKPALHSLGAPAHDHGPGRADRDAQGHTGDAGARRDGLDMVGPQGRLPPQLLLPGVAGDHQVARHDALQPAGPAPSYQGLARALDRPAHAHGCDTAQRAAGGTARRHRDGLGHGSERLRHRAAHQCAPGLQPDGAGDGRLLRGVAPVHGAESGRAPAAAGPDRPASGHVFPVRHVLRRRPDPGQQQPPDDDLGHDRRRRGPGHAGARVQRGRQRAVRALPAGRTRGVTAHRRPAGSGRPVHHGNAITLVHLRHAPSHQRVGGARPPPGRRHRQPHPQPDVDAGRLRYHTHRDGDVMAARAAATSWSEANQAYLVAEFARLKRLLTNGHGHAGAAASARAPDLVPPPAVEALVELFGLSGFERDVILLAAATEMDSEMAELCPRLTLGAALAIIPEPHWSALSSDRPLREFELIRIEAEQGLTSATVRIDERVLHYLAGLNAPDPRVRSLVTPIPYPAADTVASEHARVAEKALVLLADRSRAVRLLQLRGDDPDGQEDVAALIALGCGCRLYAVRAEELPPPGPDLDTLAALWRREALLLPAVLLVHTGAAGLTPATRQLVGRLPVLAIIACRESVNLSANSLRFDVDRPPPTEQRRLWAEALGEPAPALDAELDVVSEQYRLSAQKIRATGTLLAASAGQAGP